MISNLALIFFYTNALSGVPLIQILFYCLRILEVKLFLAGRDVSYTIISLLRFRMGDGE